MDGLCRRQSCIPMISAIEVGMFGSVRSKLEDLDTSSASSADALQPGDEEAAALAFVNEWLGFISDAIVGLLLLQIAAIPKLSRQGATQLTVDIEYLWSVAFALVD